MSVIRVFLELPSEIAKGLASGQYVRNAAGVIRWAAGTDSAGQVVCHLKEILVPGNPVPHPVFPIQPAMGQALLLPIGAMMVFQMAAIAFLVHKLDNIEKAVEAMHTDVKSILDKMDKIATHLWLEPLIPVAHGAEFLLGARFRPDYLEESRKSFVKARAEIKLFLSRQGHMDLLEHLPAAEQLFLGLSTSLTGEYFCLQSQEAQADEVEHVLGQYQELFSNCNYKLAQIPPLNRYVPTPAQLRHQPKLKPLMTKVCDTYECIDAEKIFARALSGENRKLLSDHFGSLQGGTVRGTVLIYPE